MLLQGGNAWSPNLFRTEPAVRERGARQIGFRVFPQSASNLLGRSFAARLHGGGSLPSFSTSRRTSIYRHGRALCYRNCSAVGTVLDTYGKVKAVLPSRPLTGHEEYLLGFAYLTGTHGNEVNFKKAREYFDGAVQDHSYYRAWIGLGIMYRTGAIARLEGRPIISPQDLSMAAREFYSVIIEPETAGDRVAEYDLGLFYEQKAPSKAHYLRALYWYYKSNAQHFPPAARAIHRICATSEGLSGDLGPDCGQNPWFQYHPDLQPIRTRPLNTLSPMPWPDSNARARHSAASNDGGGTSF